MTVKMHRRYVLGIYLLVAFSIVALAASFLGFGIRPLTRQLQIEHDQNLQMFLEHHARLIQGVADSHFDLCRATASRTTIRHALEDYLEGRISREQLSEFTRPHLTDFLRYNPEVRGITRFDRRHRKIAEVGRSVEAEHRAEDLPSGNLIEVRGPFVLDQEARGLVYYSPIIQEDSGLLGYDILLLDTEKIQAIVDTPYSTHGNLFLAADDRPIYSPTATASRVPMEVVQSYLQGQRVGNGYIVERTGVPHTRWTLYLVVDEEQSLGDINDSIRLLTWFIVATTVVIFLAAALVLRPIIRALVSHGKLFEMSYRDGLTGLANHRRFQSAMDDEVTRVNRYGHQLSVLMLDIDHFKHINDTHGHPCGDDVLREISTVIRSTVRNTDTAARYGGEEFAIVLPQTDTESARKLAERLRHNVERAAIMCGGIPLRVTISIGMATYVSALGKRGKADIIQAADRALYQSKRTGRNRVTDSGPWQHAARAAPDTVRQIHPRRDGE